MQSAKAVAMQSAGVVAMPRFIPDAREIATHYMAEVWGTRPLGFNLSCKISPVVSNSKLITNSCFLLIGYRGIILLGYSEYVQA